MNIMRELFHEFEENDIQYVHFKGNSLHLERNFEGKGDFDVLVNPYQNKQTELALLQLNAKRKNSATDKKNPGIDNWLLFDEESGIIYHLHLHYRLALGRKPIPEYSLPFETKLLQMRVYNEKYGMYVNSPENEIILVYIRSVVGGKPNIKNVLSQRELLLPEIDSEKLKENSRIFFDEDAEAFVHIVENERFSTEAYHKMQGLVKKHLKRFALCGKLRGQMMNISARLSNKIKKFCNSRLGSEYVYRKTSDHTGLIIAFVGVDGSGKSTTAKEIYKWLSSKMEARRYYMGLGDGKTTLLGKILKGGHRLVESKSSGEAAGSIVKPAKQAYGFLEKPMFYIKKRMMVHFIYSVESNNYKKVLEMQRYRIRGGISILDRYPQIELPDVNDGPKIARYSQFIKADRFIKRMTELERKKLSIVTKVKPDLVFRLNISAEESMRRKPEQKEIAVYQKKIDEIRQIGFQGATIIDIDAEQPYESELKEIKKIIWSYL